MVGFLVRALGLWIWAGAVVAAIYDGTKSLAASQFVTTPAGETWFALHPASLNGLQVSIERHFAEFMLAQVGSAGADLAYGLWNPVITTILQAPTWAVLGLIGLFFLWIGRRRAQPRRISAHA